MTAPSNRSKKTIKFLLTQFVNKGRFSRTIGGIAQLGEHLICIQKVAGSIPVASTNLKSIKPVKSFSLAFLFLTL